MKSKIVVGVLAVVAFMVYGVYWFDRPERGRK